MLFDEIHSFSGDYINFKNSRTAKRKAKIREAYKLLTGKNIEISCSTCYIEALFEIINNTKMATRKGYELKRGYLAQFQDAYKGIKSFTNDQLTDELAEEYLRRYPSRIIYFSRTPAIASSIIPLEIRIIPPVKKESIKEPEINTKLIADALNAVSGIEPPKTELKKVVKKSVKIKK